MLHCSCLGPAALWVQKPSGVMSGPAARGGFCRTEEKHAFRTCFPRCLPGTARVSGTTSVMETANHLLLFFSGHCIFMFLVLDRQPPLLCGSKMYLSKHKSLDPCSRLVSLRFSRLVVRHDFVACERSAGSRISFVFLPPPFLFTSQSVSAADGVFKRCVMWPSPRDGFFLTRRRARVMYFLMDAPRTPLRLHEF